MRSPRAYTDLRESGVLKLPSGRLLRYYKNCLPSTPGPSREVLEFMMKEADRLKIGPEGHVGGLAFVKMSIQVSQWLLSMLLNVLNFFV